MSMCPACNGLTTLHISCEYCGNNVTIYGRTSDYQDDYSAYEEYDVTSAQSIQSPSAQTESEGCTHYVGCENCRTTYTYSFKEVDYNT
ncbi:hypothetical protein M3689_09035 [Alkalihalophilus marmarensis]|jgi:ribosomal protein S27E|uniref:hypothetical protein n=1 Tax=Alkalihalophilus marmarensis TaxID=521377 RepID=UPI0020412A14|nr:hypothetical protein [Alkalihalophilus marmarensis]MCM3489443.1 hypothetical protein [Alkalihalophilus marmarensis]